MPENVSLLIPDFLKCNRLFADLFNAGYVLNSRANVSVKEGSKDSWYFVHKSELAWHHQGLLFMSITFNESDRIRLYDYPIGMEEDLQLVIANTWGSLQHSKLLQGGVWEYKLKVVIFCLSLILRGTLG
jgi:hypothetical protein